MANGDALQQVRAIYQWLKPPTQHYMYAQSTAVLLLFKSNIVVLNFACRLLFSPSYKNQGGVVYIRFVVALQGEAFPLLGMLTMKVDALLVISHCVLVDSTCWMIVPLTVTRYRSTLDCFTGTYSIGSTIQTPLINEPYNETAAAQYGWDGGGAVIGSKYAIENTQGKKKKCSIWDLSLSSALSIHQSFDRASASVYHLSVDHVNKKWQHRSIPFRAIKPYPSILCFWLLSIA